MQAWTRRVITSRELLMSDVVSPCSWVGSASAMALAMDVWVRASGGISPILSGEVLSGLEVRGWCIWWYDWCCVVLLG